MVDTYLLAIQARILQWVALGWLAIGLWLEQDPVTVAWRAAVGAYVAMRVSRWLLDRVARVVQAQVTAEEAERQMHAADGAPPAAGKPDDRQRIQQAMAGQSAARGVPA